MRAVIEAWQLVHDQIQPGFSGPIGHRYEAWQAILSLHPGGLWRWDVVDGLRVVAAEHIRYLRQLAETQHASNGRGSTERALLAAYGDELAEEMRDGAEDPH